LFNKAENPTSVAAVAARRLSGRRRRVYEACVLTHLRLSSF